MDEGACQSSKSGSIILKVPEVGRQGEATHSLLPPGCRSKGDGRIFEIRLIAPQLRAAHEAGAQVRRRVRLVARADPPAGPRAVSAFLKVGSTQHG